MEVVGEQNNWSFLANEQEAKVAKCGTIRQDSGHRVGSYLELATKIAELQYRNRDYVLFFRGQNTDYKNIQRRTTLKPSLFRAVGKGNPDQVTLEMRFNVLFQAENRLGYLYNQHQFLGFERLNRQQIIRWAILQHYEVCPTPLLDVTHSLRIAASFASDGSIGDAFIFVLAIPNLSGAITASAEAGIQTVRLSSVCPPSAVRPHIQEGYLLGEYPDMRGYDQKLLYPHYEIDFGRRLIAKFRFDPSVFWRGDDFPKISRAALYPDQMDPLCEITRQIKHQLGL
jgi:hypothetical protein